MSPSEDRRQLIERMLKARGVRVAGGNVPIPRRGSGDSAPASFNQEGLWFLDQLEGENANYNIPGTVRLQGPLDVPALERSLAAIVARHESLRTTFREQPGGLLQVVSPIGRWTLPVMDLTDLDGAARVPEAARLATEEARTPFDLAVGPLFRARLLRLGDEDHALTLNFHHIIADGWSMGVVSAELKALYHSLRAGVAPSLPELPVQFGDFAVWQRQRLRDRFAEELVGYWTEHLRGAPAVLELAADRPRPSSSTYRGAHYPVTLSARLSADLAALARRLQRSLFTVLLGAFKLVIYADTDVSDVVVGCTFGNRVRSELEGVIGHFANTMPLRTDLSGDPTFEELLRRVSSAVVGGQAHQELPFPLLAKKISVDRDTSRNPFYQVVFDLLTPDHNPALFGYGLSSPVDETLRLSELTIAPMDVEGGISRFDLSVFLWDLPHGLSGTLEYSTELFDEASIERLAEEFESVARQVVEAPGRRISEITERVRSERLQREQAEARGNKERLHSGLKGARRRAVRLNPDK